METLYGRIHAGAWRVCDQRVGELTAVGRCVKEDRGRRSWQGECPIADRVLPEPDRKPAANDHRESMKARGVWEKATFWPLFFGHQATSDVSRAYDLL